MKVLKRFNSMYKFHEFKRTYKLRGTGRTVHHVVCQWISHEPAMEIQTYFADALGALLYVVEVLDHSQTFYNYFVIDEKPDFTKEDSLKWAQRFYEKYKDGPTMFSELFL